MKLLPFQFFDGRIGLSTNPPPQFGHVFFRIVSTQVAQKVLVEADSQYDLNPSPEGQFHNEQGGHLKMETSSEATFQQRYQQHLQHLKLKGLQPKTIEAYARAIRRVGARFNHQIDDLSVPQLADYFTNWWHRIRGAPSSSICMDCSSTTRTSCVTHSNPALKLAPSGRWRARLATRCKSASA